MSPSSTRVATRVPPQPETPHAEPAIARMVGPEPCRREILAGLATTALVAAPISALAMDAEIERDLADVPSPSAEAHDAELIALGDRWRLEDDAYDAACDRETELHKATVLPDRPEAMFLREGDRRLELDTVASGYRVEGRRPWFWVGEPDCKMATARRLRGPQTTHRDFPPEPGSELYGEDVVISRRVPWPERQARADEIVAAYDAHEAERAAAREASGLTAAATESDRLGKVVEATIAEVHATPARTMAGLAVKATIICDGLDAGHNVEAETALFARNVLALAGIAA